MFLKSLILLFFLNVIAGQFSYYRSESPCPARSLLHGRIRLRQRMKLAEHICHARYTLVGSKYATCRKGEWDEPKPVCVRSGCSELDEVKNSINITSFKGAWVNFFCLPGYKLEGSQNLYCDGRRWNSSVPACVESNQMQPASSCDFEEQYMCGWTQDTLHDFDWLRYNLRTPSSYFQTGPSYDHTYGKNGTGYYMYVEGTSQMPNDSARLLSPVYDAGVAKNGCFVFFYHMYGRDIGGLRVYQKPDSVSLDTIRSDSERKKYMLFEAWGEQGDQWFDSVSQLRDYAEDFQIVVEGIRGKSYASDLAIDDVALLQGENCTKSIREASTPPPITVDSCAGRCYTTNDSGHNCGCDIICVLNRNCCLDYLDICEYGSSSDVPDWFNDTMDLPQTQKLVATKTTQITTTVAVPTPSPSTTTTTTKLPTTTTTQPTRITRPPTTRRATTKPTTTKLPITRLATTKLATTKLAPTKLSTTKLTTTKHTTTTVATTKLTTTSMRKFTVPISTTTTRKYTRYTPKPTFNTTNKLSTKISGQVNKTTTRLPTKTTFPSSKNIDISRSTKASTSPTQKKILAQQASEGMSGTKAAVIVIVVIVLFCGFIWVGYAARSSRSFAVMAHLRGRARGESEVRYLNSDFDDNDVE